MQRQIVTARLNNFSLDGRIWSIKGKSVPHIKQWVHKLYFDELKGRKDIKRMNVQLKLQHWQRQPQ